MIIIFALLAICILHAPVSAAEPPIQVRVLYDAFGKPSNMVKDWGLSVLIEFKGKRILFDTGNDPAIFAKNIARAKVDLTKIDFVIISHRHLDHAAGLGHLLQVSPRVKIYAPGESFGVFGSSLPGSFFHREENLPAHLRYYDGEPPDKMIFGGAWGKGDFELIEQTTQVAPGMHLIALVSEAPGTKEIRELSLVIETAKGLLVIAGCSHSGVDQIAKTAAKIDSRILFLMGGFHLPAASEAGIRYLAATLKNTYRVKYIAPGHCTGEPAQFIFSKIWEDNYIYAGLGSVIKFDQLQ